VLGGTLPETVLDTYEIERKHHARAMIKLAKFIGTAMTAGGELGNIIRRAVAPRLHLVPGLTDLATDSQTPPLHRSDLVARQRLRRALAGRLCPNAILDDDRRFDDVAAGRFAIVTSTEPSATQRAEIERRGAVLITARPGSELHQWLRQGGANAAIVRPDGTVLSAGRHLSKLCAVLPGFNGNFPLTTR
jgi:3-(3-hydroxy-phenyl)propionate hydroxylase